MSGMTDSHVACSWASIPAQVLMMYDARNSMEFLLTTNLFDKDEARACLNFFLKDDSFHGGFDVGFTTRIMDQMIPLRIKRNLKSCVAQMDPKLEALLFGARIKWQTYPKVKPPYRFIISNQVRHWRHVGPDGRIGR